MHMKFLNRQNKLQWQKSESSWLKGRAEQNEELSGVVKMRIKCVCTFVKIETLTVKIYMLCCIQIMPIKAKHKEKSRKTEAWKMNILSLQYSWLRKSRGIQVHFPVSDLLRKFTGLGTQLYSELWFITVKEYKAKSAKGKGKGTVHRKPAQASVLSLCSHTGYI